jgi:hypothetical protein
MKLKAKTLQGKEFTVEVDPSWTVSTSPDEGSVSRTESKLLERDRGFLPPLFFLSR